MSPQTLPKPYWYKLLDYWVNTGDNSGLSLPFIIGAKDLITPQAAPETGCIGGLLQSIVAGTALEQCATLKYCGTIQAYILGLQTRNEVEKPYFLNASGMPTLALIDGVFDRRQTLDDIVSFLEEKYLPLILSAKYSRQNTAFGVWGPFNADDLKLIQNSVK
jgi:hypothetical protein